MNGRDLGIGRIKYDIINAIGYIKWLQRFASNRAEIKYIPCIGLNPHVGIISTIHKAVSYTHLDVYKRQA